MSRPIRRQSRQGFAARAMRASFALALLASAALPALQAGLASAKCDPGRANSAGNWHAGWTRSPGTTVGGVYSQILNYSPWVWPTYDSLGGTNLSTSWTMLTSTTSGVWAQIGWFEAASGTRGTIIQYKRYAGSSPDTWTYTSNQPAVGNYTYYTTLYDPGSGKFSFKVDNSTYRQETVTFVPDRADVSAETTSPSVQMPGSTAENEAFFDTSIYYSGSWSTFSGSVVVTNSGWHATSGPWYGTLLYTRDKACAS